MNNFKKRQQIYVSLDKKNKWFACLNAGSYSARKSSKNKNNAIDSVIGSIVSACNIKEFKFEKKGDNYFFHYNL